MIGPPLRAIVQLSSDRDPPGCLALDVEKKDKMHPMTTFWSSCALGALSEANLCIAFWASPPLTVSTILNDISDDELLARPMIPWKDRLVK
ncbi:uncharacterized protein BO87DRAFT_368858 [Aspergillus neoniger CBS 115656]|uniref:Uncharacterized protein n=1 Tax=Aspergillus neoniger (strain CBS 115656) TaxID=1448310 RepID=A0A318Y5C9_ASPNB|nr:hypothetical protein BO87DRAFT_368858 [Aspergillus neoniger CBS 115656]PYH29465.1 hypothetical protein BO87DRAFT_368858 [Aspergillus neoniger CBS 115656]